MKRVSVAVLKQKLSNYLHLVEEGEELVVTSHSRPVAQLIPHASQGPRIRPPISAPGVLKGLKGIRMLSSGRSAVTTLIEERARR